MHPTGSGNKSYQIWSHWSKVETDDINSFVTIQFCFSILVFDVFFLSACVVTADTVSETI